MSVQSRPTRCPRCSDDQLREVARTEYGSPNELDEILFECLASQHQFVWTDADTDESLAAKMDGYPNATAGRTYSDIRKAEIGERAIANIREVEIDPVAGAGYFTIMPSATIVATTERRVNIDWDVDGNIIGIELLDLIPPAKETT